MFLGISFLDIPSFFVFVTFIFANLWHTNSYERKIKNV